MRWRGRKGSANVEDRRGRGGGMMGRVPGGRPAGFGCGGLLLIAVLALLFGADPQQLFDVMQQTQVTTQQPQPVPVPRQGGASDELGQFASVVLADTEQTWGDVFQQRFGARYREPTMVLFSGQVRSACGFNSAATRPVLLPGGRQGLPRPQLLRPARAPLRRAGRLRPGLRHRPRGRPSRAEPAGHHEQVHRARRSASRERANAAVGAPGAAGRLPGRRLGALTRNAARSCSSPATSRRGCGRPPRSATTTSSAIRGRECSPSPGPTARPSSASAGCVAASRPATPAHATPSAERRRPGSVESGERRNIARHPAEGRYGSFRPPAPRLPQQGD